MQYCVILHLILAHTNMLIDHNFIVRTSIEI